MIYELISKVLINVLLISIFISVFFFTYGTYIERKVILNQMDILANNFMNTFELTGSTTNKSLYNYIKDKLLSKENIDKISSGDAKALSGNKVIIDKVTSYIVIFILVVSSIIFLLAITGKIPDLKNILIESFIILIFIGITEYVFIEFFGAKFISIDTNIVKYKVIKCLETYNKALKKTKQ
jgi:hypothetical protein